MIHFTDVTGTVQGLATPGAKANICTEEILFAYPWAKVDISGGSTVYADGNGNFTIPNAGTSAVTVRSYVDGMWFTIDNRAGAEETLSAVVTPPGPVNFIHNQANTDMILAQTNIYVSGNACRDWVLEHCPTFPGVPTDTAVPTIVNRTDYYCPCNAWSSSADGSINFCQPGDGCPNTAWQSVLNHEYGHHCIDFTISGQGEYGEGMADCFSMLPVDDPNLGYGFSGDCDEGLRTADNDCQYSATTCTTNCGSEIHDCGRLLSGIVWSIRNELIVTEPVDYLDILSDIVVNSILVHSGTGINAQIAIDFLTLDDNDGNINNGTPHRTEICAGFSAHGLSCPALQVGLSVSPTSGLTATGQAGGPFSPSSVDYTVQNLGPTATINYSVSKSASWLTITNATGSLNIGQTAIVTVALNANANSLPDGDYFDTVQFVNTTDHVGDTTRPVILRVGVNDNCANAKIACPGQSYTGTTVGMTVDGATSCGTSSSTPDVWYKYTPASSGTATFSLCSGTNYDSVLSVHSACPGSSGNTLNCDDDGCGGYSAPSTITRSVTGGTTYIIRISGWSGATGSYALTITGPACAPADTTPPAPNPMTFASAPAPAGATSITMTATTATDATTPPVSYFFDFVSGGAGGTDSSWQSGTTYVDTGLTANTSYTYAVKARDSVSTPNETSYSGSLATATLIETPSGVTFGAVTDNSIVLNAGGTFTNLTTGSSGLYFDSTTTGGDGGINAWVTVATDTATGLSPNTSYTFQVKARNQNSAETAYSAAAAKTTLALVPAAPTLSNVKRLSMDVDANPNGNPANTEFAIQCTASADANWNGKYVSATGTPSAAAVWQTDGAWSVRTVTNLKGNTTYTFAVKARNFEMVETALSPGTSKTTKAKPADLLRREEDLGGPG